MLLLLLLLLLLLSQSAAHRRVQFKLIFLGAKFMSLLHHHLLFSSFMIVKNYNNTSLN